VFEDLSVKRAVFAQLGQTCRPDAILATNASYLDPRLIAEGLPHPDRFIGNRILKRYRAEAETLVRLGTPIAAIDAAMRAHGFAMGPFEAQDLGGLDIA
jgi:3-hydroxyacyl-CoA dehydrogenase